VGAARRMAELFCENGWACINGGGNDGCMGSVNDAYVENNGKVEGIIHEMWIGEEKEKRIPQTVVGGNNLAERKAKLLEDVDAIVCVTGGPGSMDEFCEAVCLKNLKFISAPVCLLNIDGYWDPLIAQYQHTYDCGFTSSKPHELFKVCTAPEQVVEWIKTLPPREQAAPQSSSESLFSESFAKGLIIGLALGVSANSIMRKWR